MTYSDVMEQVTTPAGNTFMHTIRYYDECTICQDAMAKGEMPFISHENCLYKGRISIGHTSSGHCTANACY
jgi:hypothetical protein